jgi:hypothetical protein
MIQTRPGSSVDIVVGIDDVRETIDVRKAIIYEISGVNLIFSQTTPPLSGRYVGEIFTITYLKKDNNGSERLGFFVKLLESVKDYKLASGVTAGALLMARTSEIKKQEFFNLRMHHRINPGCGSNIEIFIGKERVNIMDISIGGAMLSCPNLKSMEPGQSLTIILVMSGETFKLNAKVVRKRASTAGDAGSNMPWTVIQFQGASKRLNYLLGGKIFALEREQICRGLGLNP